MDIDIMSIGYLEIMVVFLISIIAFILPVIAFWKICSKAGFPGILGLLTIVPIANIILLLYLAFAEWPVLKGGGQSYQ